MPLVRRLVLVVLLVLAVPASADAARVGGYEVTWPAATTVAPGSTIAVGVKPASARAVPRRAAVVSLVRLTAAGRPFRRVAERRVRRATIELPLTSAGTYRVRVAVGGQQRSRTVQAPVPPAPLPPPFTPIWPCGTQPPTTFSATFAADKPSFALGDPYALTLTNTGEGCLLMGYGVRYELLKDGAWVPLDRNDAEFAILTIIGPGQSWAQPRRFPSDLEPGHYRLSSTYAIGQGWPGPGERGPPVPVSVEVDVVPPPSP